MVRTLNPLCDRIGLPTVEAVVRDFARRQAEDPVLAPWLAHAAGDEEHLATVMDYWWTAMGGRLDRPPRPVDMMGRHADLALTETALARWLALFETTLADHLDTAEANDWAAMARAMAEKLRASGLIHPD
ncbi:hemoglobin [Thiohalospira halophila DSM 15071]|uniref:Hemoglobin n=1 Tax=Thiohalospira halophila DSM 15071 TaxID=1123397 RepID=A0A1I1V9G0_9GAMM|nr:group III truncated hemoglobin [Thiohalospira halophila]SFD77050.1 hemoglobin [Thiohalospira halophila DSM 15071]